MPNCFGRVTRVAPFAAVVTLLGGEACAQGITVDGRLSAAQTLAGPNYAIGAGLGRQVGANLFHSFGAFGLKQGETATFGGPAGVANVIGRVTGGTASSIDGGINSSITGANLYLINPAGVVFGPNASVNVSGSFHASSADYLRMKDGARFQASNPDASTLSAAPPEAFGFLSAAPQPVRVNGSSLQLKPSSTQGGRTLGLVGGAVTISGGVLYAPGGTVHVASAAGPGEVPVDPRAGPPATAARFGSVQVASKSFLRAGGENGGNGGSVFIRAGDLSVSASDIGADNGGSGPGGVVSLHGDRTVTLSNGTTVRADATGSGRGPDLSIGTAAGGTVTLDAAAIRSVAFAAGDSGAVAISTGALTLRNGTLVLSQAQDRGNGGPVSVAADSVLLDGSKTSFSSRTFGTGLAGAAGAGGKISLTGGTLSIQNGASIEAYSFGTGLGGPISVAMTGNVAVAAGSQILSGSDASGASDPAAAAKGGDAGPITLSAGALSLLRGGSIRSVASASGNAGEVALNVNGALTIDATDFGGSPNGVSSETMQNSSGSASTVRVSAGSVSVLNGGFINGNTHGTGAAGSVLVTTPGALLLDGGGGGGTEIGSSALGTQSGNAGMVTVSAGRVTVQNGALIDSNTAGSGQGGNATVTTPGALLLDGQGVSGTGITAGATGPQSSGAGVVTVNAGNVAVQGGAQIASNTTGPDRGGDVTVTTPGALLLDGQGVGGTGITVGAAGPQSGAGVVTVKAGSVAVQGGAQIASDTTGPSRGSDVTVNTGTLTLLRGGSIRSVASGSGSAGEVALNVDGALVIDATNFGGFPNGVSSETTQDSSGSAGMVRVVAGSVSVLNGGFINSNTRGTGTGGSVAVATPGVLLLDGGGGNNTEIGASALGTQSGNAGTVTVSAGRVTVQNGAQIDSGTAGLGRGVDVTVMTPDALLLDGQGVNGTGITAGATGPQSSGAGVVTVNAGSVAVQGGAQITGSTAGSGRGGDVTVNTGALTVSGGSNVISVSSASAPGNAGEVTLNVAGALTVDAAQAGTSTNGVSSEAEPGSLGAAGTVRVNAGSVSVLNGGFINSSAGGTGAGGSVVVRTPGALLLNGRGQVGGPAEISASATQTQSGNAGSVTIEAGSVSVLHSGVITSNTQGKGAGGSVVVRTPGALLLDGQGDASTAISANTTGEQSGDAGTVTVSAGSVTVQGRAQIASATNGPGQGGDVGVTAGSVIRLSGPGPQISAISTHTGAAGSITVSAPQLFLRDGAGISTAARAANGGNITIGAGDLLYLQRASITTSVNSASGNGGNIAVEPRLVVLDRSAIQANAVGGNGGNVQVQAGQLVQSAGSAITATSQLGVSGRIFLTGPPLDLNGSLVVLASDLRAAAALLREGCAVRGASPRSSLVAAGRGGPRQGLEAALPALYFAHRPIRDGGQPASAAPAAPARASISLSSRCG